MALALAKERPTEISPQSHMQRLGAWVEQRNQRLQNHPYLSLAIATLAMGEDRYALEKPTSVQQAQSFLYRAVGVHKAIDYIGATPTGRVVIKQPHVEATDAYLRSLTPFQLDQQKIALENEHPELRKFLVTPSLGNNVPLFNLQDSLRRQEQLFHQIEDGALRAMALVTIARKNRDMQATRRMHLL